LSVEGGKCGRNYRRRVFYACFLSFKVFCDGFSAWLGDFFCFYADGVCVAGVDFDIFALFCSAGVTLFIYAVARALNVNVAGVTVLADIEFCLTEKEPEETFFTGVAGIGDNLGAVGVFFARGNAVFYTVTIAGRGDVLANTFFHIFTGVFFAKFNALLN